MVTQREHVQNGLDQTISALRAWAVKQPLATRWIAEDLAEQIEVGTPLAVIGETVERLSAVNGA